MQSDQAKETRKQVILLSLFFALYFGGAGFVSPFITLHFYSTGMNGFQIGSIATISGLLALIGAPLLGAIYDHSKRKRFVFQVMLISSGILLFLLGWSQYFLVAMIVYSLYRIGASSSIPISENLAFNISRSEDSNRRKGFGFMRLWGSVAFALTALIGGWIVEKFDIKINFLLFLFFMVLVTGLVYLVSKRSFNHTEKDTIQKEQRGSHSIIRILINDKYLLLMVFALAITHPLGNGIRQFEPIFMSQLSISESMIGLAATLSALFEVPFMLWADRLFVRYGITKILLFVFIADLIRRMLVWFFPLGWMVFVTQVATSVSFSLRLVATVYLVNQHIPKKHTTTALALISMSLYGISNMISCAISGVVFDEFGGRMLYLLSAIGCLVSLFFAFFASNIENKKYLRREG